MDDDPTYDMQDPFPVEAVTRAAEHVFNQNRFDKDLLEEERSHSHSTLEHKTTRHRRQVKVLEESDDDSESEDNEPVRPKTTS